MVAGAEAGFSAIWHGGETTTFLGRMLYAKAGMIESPLSRTATPEAAVLETSFAPMRRLIARAPNEATAAYLSYYYEICLQYACTAETQVDPISPAAQRAAWERISGNPGGFLALAWRNYRDLWRPWRAAVIPNEAPVINAYVAANQPVPFAPEMPALAKPAAPLRLAILVQPVMQTIGAITFLLALTGLAAAARRQRPVATMAFIAALAVQGSLVLTALVNVAEPRYMLSGWPAMMTALVCLLWWLVEWRSDKSRNPPEGDDA